jgi:hypothetical protein
MPADPAEAIAIPRVKHGWIWVLCEQNQQIPKELR